MSDFVRNYYDQHAGQEWDRLARAKHRIEFASTLFLIEKYFPKNGRVCDIGGGPGRYTIELARRGYQVTLFDLSAEEVKMARVRLEEEGLQAQELLVGDALQLNRIVSGHFDAALLMGPMYHVIDAGARHSILAQLKDILRPNGVAIVAYINSWGLMRTGLVDFPHWYEDISRLRALLHDQVFEGQTLSEFTECYWSTPEAARAEIESAGLEILSYAGAESFVAGMKAQMEELKAASPKAYANVVQVAAETCEMSQFRDCADHLHFVVRRPSAQAG